MAEAQGESGLRFALHLSTTVSQTYSENLWIQKKLPQMLGRLTPSKSDWEYQHTDKI